MLQPHEVSLYGNGADAVKAFAQRLPELVLLAVPFSIPSGIATLKQLRANPDLRLTPIIAISAHSMSGDRERFLNAGFDGYIAKPIMGKTALMDAIRPLIGMRSAAASC